MLAAVDGQDAMTCFENHNRPIDLLFPDVNMPRMNGPELATQLIELQPNLKVLFASGLPDNLLTLKKSEDFETMGFMNKPYSIANLTKTIRDILDCPTQGNALDRACRERVGAQH